MEINSAYIDGNNNIIIQGVNGANISINPNNSSEIRQLIMNLGSKLEDLPTDILKMIENKQDLKSEIKTGANLHLSIIAHLHEISQFRALKFGLTITNLTKENRYFTQPFFKIHPKFEIKPGLEHGTFVMIPDNNFFPVKLEYGQPSYINYEIKQGAYDMYKQVLNKDPEAHIQAFTTTTVGEIYESNKLSLNELFGKLEWLMQ